MRKPMELPPDVLEWFRKQGRKGGLKGGRKGGLIGGKRSLKTMTAKQRQERARKAGLAAAKARRQKEEGQPSWAFFTAFFFAAAFFDRTSADLAAAFFFFRDPHSSGPRAGQAQRALPRIDYP